jgi:hypothetical protein
MKNLSIKLPMAVGALMLCSTAVFAQSTETQSFSANVSGALQGDTGFLTGGQVQVNGVGQGSVTLSRGEANIGVTSGATAGLTASANTPATNDIFPTSSSSMVTTFEFDRDVDTAAALVGIGNVVAQGESIGGTGVVGSATANAERAGTGTGSNSQPSSGSAASPTSAQGSLVGNFSTQNTLQLLGQGALFAGAQSLDVGETNIGVAAGLTGPVSANTTAIDFDGMVADTTAGAIGVDTTNGNGALFFSTSVINGGTGGASGTIDMNVANAGQGSVLVSASTGGFFGQGTTFGASANPTLAETNGFFD